MRRGQIAVLLTVLLGTITIERLAASSIQSDEVEMSPISGSVEQPRRHFRLKNAERLEATEAQRLYTIVKSALAAGYIESGMTVAAEYQGWTKYNTLPYPSVTHGNHYLNNYANTKALAYGEYEQAGRLPVGAVIVKDSFAKTETGGILLGPLFVMEKMPAGFNYASGDWKYTLVGPDGLLLGETNGVGSKRVEYCISCHLAAEDTDHLFFVPQDVRVAR